MLLVLDQFEEFIILAKPEQREAFKALVTELQSCQNKGFTLAARAAKRLSDLS
jgi:hypothetical protein